MTLIVDANHDRPAFLQRGRVQARVEVGSALGLSQQGGRITDRQPTPLLVVQVGDHPVLDQHRKAPRTQPQALGAQIQRQAGGLGKVGTAVGQKPNTTPAPKLRAQAPITKASFTATYQISSTPAALNASAYSM